MAVAKNGPAWQQRGDRKNILVGWYCTQKKTKKKTKMQKNGDVELHLLSWAVNVAARARDSILALILTTDGKAWGSPQSSDNYEVWSIDRQLIPLIEICKLKQVQLDIRFAIGGSLEKLLTEHAFSSRASMVVVSPSCQYSLRYAQKRGSYLAGQLPEGCSVVVVKDFKVLYYKETEKRPLLSREGYPPHYNKNRTGQSLHLASDVYGGTDTNSPRGVFEGSGLSSSESDCSSTPSSSSYTTSLRKHLLSYTSLRSRYDNDEDEDGYYGNTMMRPASLRGTVLFHLKRLTSSSRFSIKSFLSSTWNAGFEAQRSSSSSCVTPMIDLDAKWRRSWKCFPFDEILLATNGFSSENLVGKGGYAEVYEGSLPNGKLIAVKRLKEREEKEAGFLKELGILAHVSHPNTMPLIGFCVESGLHLIFALSQRGNLSSWLHGGGNTEVMEWCVRYKVAVGTARGLHYLHTGCPRRIIHRDIKSSNILLTQDFEPQISDFGLAKWLPDQWTHLTVTDVEGTFGYLAPEYLMHGIVDEKSDVFAFGVLLLELITGQLPIDNNQRSLVLRAKPLLERGNIAELVDPCLAGLYETQKMQSIVKAASLCVQRSPVCRPSMGQVLELLTNEGTSFKGVPLSQLIGWEDLESTQISDEYNCSSTNLDDLNRHRQIALQF